MKYAVTGAAGFIGSHLCEYLLEQGHEVHGIDSFVPYYAPAVKERNIREALHHPAFTLHRLDLRSDPLHEALDGADTVFHLAATPGLPLSWTDFDGYLASNVTATQRLLEAVRRTRPRRLVYASTSSVYGRNACGDESEPTRPISPYGVTKLAAEHLCKAYAEAHGLAVTVLRYFSVYGPRQRPDMGYHKFIAAMLRGDAITVFGDGWQARGNTYVADCVAATVAAARASAGETYNVGGGETATVWDILACLETLAGRPAQIRREPARPGDQRQTLADCTKLALHTGWKPRMSLAAGLARQWEWQAEELAGDRPAAVRDSLHAVTV